MSSYFPRYGSGDKTEPRGFFLTNVPFPIPMPIVFGRKDYLIVGENENVVVFKPNEWRGVNGKDHQSPSVEEMAKRINSAEKGTLTPIYFTTDGGAEIDVLYQLAEQLEEHVQVVNHETLIDMALQKGQ